MRLRAWPNIAPARASTRRQHRRKFCIRWRSSPRARAPMPSRASKRSTRHGGLARRGGEAEWVGQLTSLSQQAIAAFVATRYENSMAGRLIVTGDRAHGSFGNAALEGRIVDAARALLAQGGEAQLLHFASSDEN